MSSVPPNSSGGQGSPQDTAAAQEARDLAANFDEKLFNALLGVIKRDFGLSLPKDDPLVIAFYVFNMMNGEHLAKAKADLDESTALFLAAFDAQHERLNFRVKQLLDLVDMQAKLSVNKGAVHLSESLEALVKKHLADASQSMQLGFLRNIDTLGSLSKSSATTATPISIFSGFPWRIFLFGLCGGAFGLALLWLVFTLVRGLT